MSVIETLKQPTERSEAPLHPFRLWFGRAEAIVKIIAINPDGLWAICEWDRRGEFKGRTVHFGIRTLAISGMRYKELDALKIGDRLRVRDSGRRRPEIELCEQ